MMLKFVNKKSELTEYMLSFAEMGQQVYRTRMNCICPDGQNRRTGILVIDTETEKLESKIIRCKACVKIQEGGCNV